METRSGTCTVCGKTAEVMCAECADRKTTIRAQDAEEEAEQAEKDRKWAETQLHDALAGLAEAANALRKVNQRGAAIRAENTITEIRGERRQRRRLAR